ncbi:glycosyltransferase family 4 protein, partial [Escherichia albertii]|nr:glycosyltransferase family 4 protein [Escherichia albertii]
KIKAKLEEKQYDIIILNSPKYLDISPDLSKTVLVQHTTLDNWWKSKYNFGCNKKLAELIRKVGKIVALSEMEGQAIKRFFCVNDSRVRVINFSSSIPFLRARKESGKKLVMLARFQNEIKRIDLVIEAMDELPDYILNVYGDGKDRDYLLALAKDRKNVKIHASITDKVSILDQHNIYILSSEFEGYPVSVIEAISRKLPVVVRNTFYSASELVEGNGVLLGRTWDKKEFCKAIRSCHENYEQYSNNSESHFYKYDPNTIKTKWVNLIQELEHA